MKRQVSKQVMRDVIAAMGQRYQEGSKREKTEILNQLVALAGCHRKHAVRLLHQARASARETQPRSRIYDEAVKEALIILWEAADRICSRRLKALLPSLIGAMEEHGHLSLEVGVRERLLSVSAATIDRLLAPVRQQGTSTEEAKEEDTSESTGERAYIRRMGRCVAGTSGDRSGGPQWRLDGRDIHP